VSSTHPLVPLNNSAYSHVVMAVIILGYADKFMLRR
jgi:hypothetical protein